MTKVNYYIDGYNFYHLVIEPFFKEGFKYKWLNLYKFCQRITSSYEIGVVRFFTANAGYDNKPTKDQQSYFDALETLKPKVKIHTGRFQYTYPILDILYPATYQPELTQDPLPKPDKIKVKKRQEKQTDVNFSVNLVKDAFANEGEEGFFDVAVIITNDTDVCGAVNIVKERGKKIILASPSNVYYTAEKVRNLPKNQRAIPYGKIAYDLKLLFNGVGEIREIRKSHLIASQFDDEIHHDGMIIEKPNGW